MEFDDRKKIDELLELERDNNRMLHRMRRSMVWGHIFTILYWLAILGAVGWSYLYLQPYIVKYWGTYQSLIKTYDNIQKVSNSIPSNLSSMLEKGR